MSKTRRKITDCSNSVMLECDARKEIDLENTRHKLATLKAMITDLESVIDEWTNRATEV